TLFLPWHLYMSYSFIHNQNKIVASPAPTFFSTRILASTNSEADGIATPNNPDQIAVSALVIAGAEGHWSSVLAQQGIKYILLAKDLDWATYAYLDSEPGVTKIDDFGSILVYSVKPGQGVAINSFVDTRAGR